MAHGYRTLQNWDQWLERHFLGKDLLAEEGELLARMLQEHYGKHALLIGVPQQTPLFTGIDIPCHSLISPPIHQEKFQAQIESDFHELPILSGSVDLAIVPHTLDFVDNPRQLFSEACRIVKPEGLIVIIGFNPYSLWGLRPPIPAHLIHAHKIKGWLKLADFALEQHQSLLFRPPLQQRSLFQKLQFMEKIGRCGFSIFGGAYILLARAKVTPLSPIRMKWKQQLSNIHIPSTITGHIARQIK